MTTPTMDGRLGRQPGSLVPENRNYGVRELIDPRGAVVRRPTFWPLPDGPFPLDQQAEGACEAFGFAQEQAAGPVVVPGMTNDWALAYYRRVQSTDRAMGNNFPDGATTLANMKTAKAEGLITGYRWAFGVHDVVDTLCSVGPVCVGIDWFASMYSTNPAGLVTVAGGVVGGHFILCAGYDEHPQWGPSVAWINSWGTGYGVAEPRLNAPRGVGWVPLDTLDALLRRDGEAVVPADFFAPAPTMVTYVARRRSRVFHKVSCPMAPRGDRREFTTSAAAVAEGLRPCKVCRP